MGLFSSLFGGTVMPQAGTPTVGTGTQTNFYNALYGLGLTPNGQGGGMMFNSMPSYTGQLTPDLNTMMASNVWNSWQPQSPGSNGLQQLLTQMGGQMGQYNKGAQTLDNFAGGGVPSALQGYLNGSQQVSFPLPRPQQSGSGGGQRMQRGWGDRN